MTTADWYYKSENGEHGPCAFDEIVDLVAQGRLQQQDDLRQGADGKWVPAASIVGLFPEPEELHDLAELDFTFEESSAPAPATDLSEFELSPSSEPAASAGKGASTAVAEPSVGDAWYYRSLGQELGPMPLAKMVSLAVDGTIGADDEVRNGESGEWARAEDVEVLAPIVMAVRAAPVAPPPAAPQPEATTPPPPPVEEPPEPSEPDEVDLRDEEPAEQPAAAEARQASDRPEPAAATAEVEVRWFCRIDGVEHGPLSLDELTAMARHGRIDQATQVRAGDDAPWVAAASIAGLFASAPPASALPSGGGRAFAPPRPVFSKPKKTRAPREPLIPKLKEQIVSNWKVLAGVAGVLALVGLIALFSMMMGGNEKEYLTELQAIQTQYNALKKEKASPEKWKPLVEKATELRSRIVPVLEKTASSEHPARQHLLWAARDHLLPMLEKYASNKQQMSKDVNHEKEFAGHLESARKLLGGQELKGDEGENQVTTQGPPDPE